MIKRTSEGGKGGVYSLQVHVNVLIKAEEQTCVCVSVCEAVVEFMKSTEIREQQQDLAQRWRNESGSETTGSKCSVRKPRAVRKHPNPLTNPSKESLGLRTRSVHPQVLCSRTQQRPCGPQQVIKLSKNSSDTSHCLIIYETETEIKHRSSELKTK